MRSITGTTVITALQICPKVCKLLLLQHSTPCDNSLYNVQRILVPTGHKLCTHILHSVCLCTDNGMSALSILSILNLNTHFTDHHGYI